MPLFKLFRRQEHHGWLMVFASAIIVGMGLGSLFSISVFLKPLAAEFGWPRGDTALAYSSAAVLNGLSGILMGALADRFSARPIVLFGGVVLGGSLVLLGHIGSLWQLYLLYGPCIGGLALGTFLAPLLTNVSFWVEKNRGLAIGVVMAGQSVGGALVPLAARYLISTVGWREAYITLGIIVWLVVIPLALLMRNAPGAAEAKAASRRESREGRAPAGGIEAGRLKIVLSIASILCCICMAVPVVHLVALATDHGIAANAAAGVMGIMMASSIIGRVGVGKVSDAIGGVRALLLFSGIQTVFVFWLSQMHTLLGFFAMSMLFGIGYGGIIPAYAIILRERMPIHLLGGSVGLVFFFANAGMGIGGYMGGALFDWSGSYTLPYAAGTVAGMGNLLIIGLLLIYLNNRRAMLPPAAAPA